MTLDPETLRAAQRCHHSLTALADEPAPLPSYACDGQSHIIERDGQLIIADGPAPEIERLDAEGDAMAGERFDGQG